MKNYNPLISIIINCYNGEKYLQKTLESISQRRVESFSAGETFSLKSVDGSTVLGSGTIASKDADNKFYMNGLVTGLALASTRVKKSIGFKGGAELDTAQMKFGSSSLLLDGVDSYIAIASNDDFGFQQNDFTISCWVRTSVSTGIQTIFDMRGGTATDITPHVFLDGAKLLFATQGTVRINGSASPLSLNTWHHIAVSRFNGWTRLYVDGSQVGSTYRDLNDYGDTKPIRFGANYLGTELFTGHIDDIHVTREAKYQTGSYTVPTAQVVGNAQTSFLTHLDGADGDTTLTEDVKISQTIEFSGGATANYIDLYDTRDFGCEVRTIGSANIYGNYGAYGDGNGVLMYLIGHNFAYIGNGKEITNDETTVNQNQEVTELNNARIRYTSVDQGGDFRVGDSFYVDQETGQVVFNAASLDVVTPNGLTFETGNDQTFIDGTKIETGDFRISGNTIETLTQDFNINSATGEVLINDNTTITGNLDVTGDTTIGGNITIGDADTDSIEFAAEVDSDIVPNVDNAYDLGSTTKSWKNIYAQNFDNGNIKVSGNKIETTDSNSDLELNTAGTGRVYIPNSDVTITNALELNGITTYNGDFTVNGGFISKGNLNQSGGTATFASNLNISADLTVAGAAQFENIEITGNVIRTTESNSDLELDASGTGRVLIPNADLEVGTLEYKTDKVFDVILCLGSVNFGSKEKIIAEVGRCVQLLAKNGIMFFRVNPGLPHDKSEADWIEFFAWNVPFIIELAQIYNLKILDIRDDTNQRKYFVYKK